MIKAVLFDIGSTLIEGPKISPAKMISKMICGNYALKEEIAEKIMTCNLKSSTELGKMLQQLYPDASVNQPALDTLWEKQLNGASVKDGALELYFRCRAIGLKTGLISNIWHPYYASFSACLPNIAEDVDVRSLSYIVGSVKPGEELFAYAKAELQLAYEEMLIIGDSYDCDIEPALNLGMKTVWFLHRYANEQEFIIDIESGKRGKPHGTVSNLEEISKEMLRELCEE